ncbi:acyl carrier protein [Nonomuraea basaltis]|uniref:acyl carrier protein n=1 Tax=Nonomuraea basaltis TaxID=2495887 RepID=UPI00110C5C4D|nr:acyl carrier protein [Nonomuraea basaltis]TMR90875.1 acyl carrier protein [Nonomuraea basaltis]
MSELAQAAIQQVVAAFLNKHDANLRPAPDDELFASGAVNSLFAIELVGFLESRYGIKFTVGDLDLNKFASLHRIAETVLAKQAASAGAA